MKNSHKRLLGLLLGVIAIGLTTPFVQAQDIVLLIDNSGSMKKNDPHSLTKQAVAHFLQNVAPGTRVAFLIFDRDVKTLAHLSSMDDNARLDLLSHLDRIDFRGPLTNMGAALAQAIEELKNASGPAGERCIVFLTDGIVDTGNRAHDLAATERMRRELTTEAASLGIRIDTIAFTDNADKKLMEHLAVSTGGTHFQPREPEDLPVVFAQITAAFAAPRESTAGAEPQVQAPAGEEPQQEPSAEVPSPAPAEAPPPAQEPPVVAEEAPAAQISAEPEASEGSIGSPAPAPEPANATADVPPVPWPPIGLTAPASRFDWMAAVTVSVVVLALLLSSLSLVLMYRMIPAPRRGPTLVRNAQERSPLAHAPKALLYHGIDPVRSSSNGMTDLTGKTTLIGRAPGEGGVVITDTGISRQHAAIDYRDYTYWVIDQASANGTFVNGRRVQGMHRLNHGDRLRLHKTEFLFLMPGRESSAETKIVPLESADEQVA